MQTLIRNHSATPAAFVLSLCFGCASAPSWVLNGSTRAPADLAARQNQRSAADAEFTRGPTDRPAAAALRGDEAPVRPVAAQSSRLVNPEEKAAVRSDAQTTDPQTTVASLELPQPQPPGGRPHPADISGANVPPVPPMPDETEPEAGDGLMTLDQLERIALANNPTLALQQAEIEKQRGNWIQAGLYPNPTLGYTNSTSGDEQVNRALVQQTFITAGKLEKARATEAVELQTALLQLEAQRMRVVNDVRLRYFEVLGAQRQIEIVEELHELSREALQAARDLFAGKQVAKTDVLQAEVQHQTVLTALNNAQAAYAAAWQRLAVIIGCPQMPPSPVAPPQEELPELDLEAEWQRLLAEHPGLRARQNQVASARRQLISAEASPVPDVTLQFVSGYDSIGEFATFDTLVALPVPLFDRNQGGIYTAASEIYRTQKEVERTMLVLRDATVSAYRDYILARNRVLQLRNEILPRLKENLELTIGGYRQGEFSYLAVLNAQQASFQASLDYVDALNQAHQRLVEIHGLQLTGGLNPATIGIAIQGAGGGRLGAVQQQLQQQRNANLSNFAPATID